MADGTNDGEPRLTAEEIATLRALVPVAADLRAEAEYRLALRLVIKTWKKTVAAAALMIGALILLREHINSLGRALSAFWKGLGG